MLLMILSNTPVWVWGLLAGLIALGFLQTRQRRVTRVQLLALPVALMSLGLWSMAPGFAARPLAALLWAAALMAAGAVGWRIAQGTRAVWLADVQRLQLPGSWLPMALVLMIFSLRYAVGVSQALHPELRAAAALQFPLALLFGALSGLFTGRALGLLRLTTSAPAPMANHG